MAGLEALQNMGRRQVPLAWVLVLVLAAAGSAFISLWGWNTYQNHRAMLVWRIRQIEPLQREWAAFKKLMPEEQKKALAEALKPKS